MSGGVDSSVAAALLVKEGYFVAGAYMKNFSPESWAGVVEADCPWEQDVADAKAVCDKLGIEFRSFNFENEYREKVIDYFFNEYAAGRTPNPDVMCNKEIKFGLFLEKALELGFDYVATGHYARIHTTPSLRAQAKQSHRDHHGADTPRDDKNIYQLLKGTDPKKDQSYFLYALDQDQLSRTLFPIGEYTKTQVRQMAKEFGLPNWDKKDSQGVCFVGHIKLREFLRQRIPEKVGQIVDASSGRVLGRHPGAWYYTVGQRQGIGIGGGKPYYVAQKDVVGNKLVVVSGRPSTSLRSAQAITSLVPEPVEGLYSKAAQVCDIHWIDPYFNPPLPEGEKKRGWECKAKIRYQQPDQDCTIIPLHSWEGVGEGVRVEFRDPQFAIAPGQSIVLYEGDRVLGGGIIETK